ncbi:hypothetical protein [Altererythrobacter sp. GH1-8]|uniref:hypothetical protein n=1 Tax=Altererythrobacter sp. GH1-8 TaxID=3349333 RepID=UPI00374D7755
MAVILGLAFIIGLVAALAIGTAFVLDTSASQMSLRRRAGIGAAVAGFLSMILPFVAVLSGANDQVPTWIPVIAVVVMGVTFALLVGFPSAYLFLKKREERRGAPVNPDIFE